MVDASTDANHRHAHLNLDGDSGSGAIEHRHMLELKDAGVRGACFNLEVWYPKQFERVCPGKARTIGRDRWLASLEEPVEVFGRGHVMSAFVGGVALDGEGAFETAEAAHKSNVEYVKNPDSKGGRSGLPTLLEVDG